MSEGKNMFQEPAETAAPSVRSLDQHTPGPWKVERAPVSHQLCVMSADTWVCGQLQADNHTKIDTGECIANARLIAASPDLLASLKQMVAWHKLGLSPSDQIRAMDAAEAAIAKAEGRTALKNARA